jgi:hypothetical protein
LEDLLFGKREGGGLTFMKKNPVAAVLDAVPLDLKVVLVVH